MMKMNSKRYALLLLLGLPSGLVFADDLPKPFAFARYQTMMDRSPFAVATAVVPVTAPSFAKDLYVAKKVTIAKDGQTATLSFNEALLRQTAGPGQNPVPAPPKQDQPQMAAQPPAPIVPGAQPIIPGAQPNAIKPMPVPALPTPPPRVRGVIPRNPASSAVTPAAVQPEL